MTEGEEYIRIIAVPKGEAPLTIREQWVGLVLPLSTTKPGPYEMQGRGVVTGNRPPKPAMCFAVPSMEAVKILEAKSSKAAAWWRSNAAKFVAPGYNLIFRADVCEWIDGNGFISQGDFEVREADMVLSRLKDSGARFEISMINRKVSGFWNNGRRISRIRIFVHAEDLPLWSKIREELYPV